MTLKVTEALRKSEIITVDGEEIRYHHIENDTNGNPRYVVHFLSLGIKPADYGSPKLSRMMQAEVYRAKWFDGGYVIQAFGKKDLADTIRFNIQKVNEFYGRGN